MIIPRPISRQPIPQTARKVFKGNLFDVYQWEQTLFDGSTIIFEKIKRPDTAYVIPVTSDRKLILAEQRQPGADPTVGLLGGRINDGETPEQGAARELMEESGLKASNLVLWDAFQFLPKLDWAIYIFIGKECERIKGQSLDGGENINLIQVSFDEFICLVAQEKFGDLEIALRVLRISMDPLKLQKTKELFYG